LGNPLVDETLPSETPDEDCIRVLLKDSDGSAFEIQTKKLVEIITDINDPAVVRWFGKHGPGKPDYSFWSGQDEMRKMHPDADFARLYGAWAPTMTDAQYFGLEHWPRDVRYYNCRSQKAFSNADGERKGEPFLGVKVPRMPSLAWKALDYMKSRHDPRLRDLSRELKDWYKNVSWIATTLLRGHIKTRKQRELLWRESDGLSVRWSGLCNAIWSDQVNTQQVALKLIRNQS
jgi:hypothetical protein